VSEELSYCCRSPWHHSAQSSSS